MLRARHFLRIFLWRQVLLALVFAGVGIFIPPRVETGVSPLMRFVGIVLVIIGAIVGYRASYLLVGTVPPVVCPR